MKIEIQLASFLAFFIYGVLFFLLNLLDKRRHLIAFYISVIVSSFLFMVVLYKINSGTVHPYFLAAFLIGIVFCKIFVKSIKIHLHRLKAKYKR